MANSELARNSKIDRRAWLPPLALGGFFIAVAVVLIVALLSYRALSDREAAANKAVSATDIGRRLDGLVSSLKDAETGQRGYLLTHDEAYLEPYKIARSVLPTELRRLRELFAGDYDELARLEIVSQRIADKLEELDQTIVMSSGGDTSGALGVVRTDRGRTLMDQVRQQVAAMQEKQAKLREGYLRARDDAARLSFVITSAGSLILLALIAWAAISMSRIFRARQTEAWQRGGIARLSLRLQGNLRLERVADDALVFLAGLLDVQVASFLVRDADGGLRRVGAWGMAEASNTVQAGVDSLPAQAVRENRLLHVRDVPAGYLPVASSLGSSKARELVIVPAAVDGVVHAVVELGFLRGLDAAEVEFCGRVSELVAITVRSAKDRARLEELLEETQRQSEELQTQQEELRVNNEELEEQGNALKQSQAGLQAQQAELEASNSQLEEHARMLEDQRDALAIAQAGLNEKAADLQRASQYKSEFLANMSHELRTPLNSTLILAKLLADNQEGNLSAEQVKFAETISGAGNDLLGLINDILDLAKIEAGAFEVSPETVSLARLAESLSASFGTTAQQKGLALVTRIDPGTPETIETDPQRLGQILKNLLSNALKFTATGEVSLEVHAVPGDRLVFAVRDTGIGIPPDQQGFIFDAFRQADGSTHRKYGGTGLGLSISRDLARLLGGDISIESRPGEGSVFSLELPQAYAPVEAIDTTLSGVQSTRAAVEPRAMAPTTSAKPEAPVRPAAAPAAKPVPARKPPLPPRAASQPSGKTPAAVVEDDREQLQAGSRLILVIEDDVRFAAILRDLAHEKGFQCVVATTANDGLTAAGRYLPNAIVLDMNLPDHSGLGVLDQLKRNPQTRHIPVHVASVADYSHEALELGAIGYVQKPVNREQLGAVFDRLEAKFSQGLRRVLIVEDDERQRDSMKMLLASDGVAIEAVASAAEALALLKSASFDCVVMDFNLPDLSAHQLLEKMAASDEVSFPPVIVYTGRTLTREEEQGLQRYSHSIIVKGARSPERLLDEVTLFLHQVESTLPAESQRLLKVARNREAIFEGRRILVVEDDIRNVFALSSVLESKGMQVEIARNGVEALAALERMKPGSAKAVDLVLMDIMMPEMDGLTCMREIRKRPEWKKLPIVALTAKAMKDDQEQCLEAGANDYIAKPLDVEKLLSLVRVWLPK